MMDMGYKNKDIPQGMEESRIIEFAAPGALDTPVLGTDSKTGQGFFNLGTINSIIRLIEDLVQGDTRTYEYRIERDGYLIRSFYSEEVKREIQGPTFPGLPLNLSPGQYQLRMLQLTTGGGLAARELLINWNKSLV